jgi:hypothetical protein
VFFEGEYFGTIPFATQQLKGEISEENCLEISGEISLPVSSFDHIIFQL